LLRNYLYFFLLSAAIAGLFTACKTQPVKPIPSLRESFSKTDQAPFGAYIAFRQMANMYRQNSIRDKKQPFNTTWNDIADTASLYVCLTPYLFVNDEEVKAMMDYVYAGNSLFVAANYIDDNLLKEANCSTDFKLIDGFTNTDSLRTTSTSSNDSSFSYYYKPFNNSFTRHDTIFSKVLGVNERNKPNYIVFFHGKGKLFLHCDPRAFSNYFILKNDNYKYLEKAFSYTNDAPQHIYWDDYYRKRFSRRSSNNDKSFSSFSEIMKHPPLKAAFWLGLTLLLLFITLGAKRRQRIIPKIKPNENTSVTFTETIGRLYLQKKDNKNIAEKSCTYFNEYIRNKYFLNTGAVNDDFITTLSRKSGVEREKVDSLYRAINHVNNSDTIDDYQLLSLNEQIQYFYKNN